MADKRKLQGEIDRCLKKVTEGVAAFEDVWQKVQTAPNINQKEKFEADLKKEIKKLQRLRDQIKTWIASSDVKDKRQLTDYRKIIEAQMERFKIVERETKTKAYSKEGLGAAAKVDPREKEKEDTKEWVTQCIENMQIQCDQFESEIEGIANKKKGGRVEKDKQERVDELKELLVQHREHIDCLELVLRGVDNDQIDLEQLKKIRDSIEYYVESNDISVCEMSTYDDLHLDSLRQSSTSVGLSSAVNDDDCLSNSSDTPNSVANSSSPSPSIINHSKDRPQEDEKKKLKLQTDDKNGQLKTGSTQLHLNCSIPSIPITPTKKDSISNSLESTTPDTPLRTPPPVAYAQAVTGNQIGGRTTSTSSQSGSNSAESKPVDHGSTSVTLANTSLPGNIFSVIANSSTVNGSLNSIPSLSTITNVSSQEVSVSLAVAVPTASTLNAESLSSSITSLSMFSLPGNQSTLFPSQASESKLLNGPSSAGGQLVKLQSHTDLTAASLKLLANASQQDSSSPAPATLSALAGTVYENLPTQSLNSDLSSHLPQLLMQQQTASQQQLQPFVLHSQQQQAPVGQQPQVMQTTTILLSPLHGVAPLGAQPLSKEQLYQMALLDTASQHLPYPSDSERLRYYLPRNPCPSPPYYPQVPPTHSDTVEFYQRLSVETLFFIFYYMEGTKAQYLAAKALKKQSWRFHTKYMMWFQRHEEPKLITEDYEQGTYIYFDYEKWCQRKKEGFTFEYRFLEDRDLN